jgi:DNA-binding NarL/FixJ family response regulator
MDLISVLLVDDNPTFLAILRRFLEEQYLNEVVILGTAGGGEEALTQALRLRPEIVLIDLAMPGVSGLEAIPRLRTALPNLGIIALTLLEPNGYRSAALAAGADEFVPKATLSTHLLPTIRRVMQAGRAGQMPATRSGSRDEREERR